MSTSRRFRLAHKIAALVASAFLGLIVAELFSRWVLTTSDEVDRFWDPVTGIRPKPLQAGSYSRGSRVRGGYSFNAQGWNHPAEFTVRRPSGTQRVCLVGDSYVEGLQVMPGQTMASVAEQSLRGKGRLVQWYPFGVSGFGTAQEHEVIRHYALDYSPDAVILVFVQNDPWDSSPYLSPARSNFVRYGLTEEDQLELMPSQPFDFGLLKPLILRSALARKVYRGLWARGAARRDLAGGAPLRQETAAESGSRLEPEAGPRTWALIEHLLASIRDLCQARGATFGLAYRGSPGRIEGTEQPDPGKERDPHCLAERSHLMGDELLAPMAARLGIPYLDLAVPLRAMVQETGGHHDFGPEDTHYNAAAHEAAGRALGAWADEVLLKGQR